MRYTMRDILDSMTAEKKKSDGTMTACLYRPLSYPVSWFFLRLSVSPNAVTCISMVFCAAAFILSLFQSTAFHWTAIAFFFVFAVLDCTDGNMARTIKEKSVYGSWIDAVGGYLAYSTQLFAIGLSCYASTCDTIFGVSLPWGRATWILVGGFASSCNALMRLFHQSMKNAELAAGIPFVQKKEKRFSEEIGVTGYLPVLYAAGFAAGFLPFVLTAYTLVYAGGFFLMTIRQLRKVFKPR